jgi:hypothetical protein
MSINERKKIKEQRLVEESDNSLTECLFSNNPHKIDKWTIGVIPKMAPMCKIDIFFENQICPRYTAGIQNTIFVTESKA